MELVLSSLETAVVNLIMFSLIPFVWWFFRHRKETGFFAWVGLYRPRLNNKWKVLAVFAIFYYFFTVLILPDL